MEQLHSSALRAKGYEDLLAVVPYRLGFHPADSIVALSLEGPRDRLGLAIRLDLPPIELVGEVTERILALLREQQTTRLLLVLYAADDRVAQPLVESLRPGLDEAGIDLVDAFRADGARWFSYTCAQDCCPPQGTQYDVTNHPFVAECVLAGGVALDSREELRRSVAAPQGPARAAMDQAYERAGSAVLNELGAERADLIGTLQGYAAEVCRLVQDYLEHPRRLGDDEVARLTTQVSAIPVRDAAWLLMDRSSARQHLSLWQQVLCRTGPEFVPAVACLTAFAAWLCGHGALAWCAVERALREDPDYSWAGLIVEALERGLSPQVWSHPGERDLRDLAG